MKVIGYTYDADYHCRDCTYKYLRQGMLSELNGVINDFLDGGSVEYTFRPTDGEGNEIHPIFDTDEWYANDIYEGNKSATLNCSDCGAEMDSWNNTFTQ